MLEILPSIVLCGFGHSQRIHQNERDDTKWGLHHLRSLEKSARNESKPIARNLRCTLINIHNLASHVRGAVEEMEEKLRSCQDHQAAVLEASFHSQHFAAAGAHQKGFDVASGEEPFHFAVG